MFFAPYVRQKEHGAFTYRLPVAAKEANKRVERQQREKLALKIKVRHEHPGDQQRKISKGSKRGG